MRRKNKTIENIEVIDIADKGHALGRTPEGEVVLLEGAVPGDVVDINLLRKKKGLKFGKVARTNVYSSYRVDAFCQHFGICGGCKWQNLNYSKQAQLKENAVRAAIKRIAGDDEQKVEPIMVAQRTARYRNKLEYAFSNKRWLTEEEIATNKEFQERTALGFHRPGAFDKVVDITECHLQDEFGDEIRNYIRSIAKKYVNGFYDIKLKKGLFRNLIIRNTTLDEWMVCIAFGEDSNEIILIMNDLKNHFKKVTSWHYVVNSKGNDTINDLEVVHFAGAEHIIERLDHIQCKIGPKSFFQTNSRQTKVLYKTAVDFAELDGSEVVYDLYTGTGTIALFAAKNCEHVIGIEQISEAIDDAKSNSLINNINNCEFLVGDVKDLLNPDFAAKFGKADVIITDPPRAGMHKDVVETLLHLSPVKIVYISCNPSTQARDIGILKEKYELVKCRPIDMFPHTSHIENVALLQFK